MLNDSSLCVQVLRDHLQVATLAGVIEPFYIFTSEPDDRHDHDQQDNSQVHHAEHELNTFRGGFQHVVSMMFVQTQLL